MQQSTALNILKSGKNVFLTGSAGAGKTYTLNQYIEYLKARKVPVAVTASTGIAATHMNGMTIHTWTGIGIKDQLTEHDLKKLKERKYLRDHIEKAKVLIIDEISMLHARQFDLINQVLKYFKDDDKPFGGMQIIVAGDFFQLPPVGKAGESNRDKFAFMASAWLEAGFEICYLTEQHRQDDNQLDQILNEIRLGQVSADSVQMLQSTQHQALEADITRLFTHNADVDQINEQHLVAIKNKAHVFEAQTEGNEKLLMTLTSSVRAPETLVLKKGAKVMFVKNNFEEGYINGTLGEVVGFIKDEEYGELPEIKLRDDTVLVVEPSEWSIENEQGKVIASFKQIPLRHAWAITVHKSQGMTLEAAEIDLSQTFEKGQGYVALSRLKSLSGLRLLGFNQKALELDSLAMKADQRFLELSGEAEQEWQHKDAAIQHDNFIRLCGGTLNPAEIARQQKKLQRKSGKEVKDSSDTLAQTRVLYEQGLDIAEIAVQRSLTQATVINHLEKLKQQSSELDLERIKPDAVQIKAVAKAYRKIKKQALPEHFNDNGSIRLRALVDALNGEYSYNDIRLALLFV
ncbi:AAA family ATPase [Alkanindiges sp. WGS2144]|uniref:AAA family ATPase n=1 Tax=Alkanindiges sp. WGS2144 TaxID=3366808 RepID=UPI003750F72C